MGFLTSLSDIMGDVGQIGSDLAPAFQVLGSNANTIDRNMASYNAGIAKQEELNKIEALAQRFASGEIKDLAGIQQGYYDAGLYPQGVALAPGVLADNRAISARELANAEEQRTRAYIAGQLPDGTPADMSMATLNSLLEQQNKLAKESRDLLKAENLRVQRLADQRETHKINADYDRQFRKMTGAEAVARNKIIESNRQAQAAHDIQMAQRAELMAQGERENDTELMALLRSYPLAAVELTPVPGDTPAAVAPVQLQAPSLATMVGNAPDPKVFSPAEIAALTERRDVIYPETNPVVATPAQVEAEVRKQLGANLAKVEAPAKVDLDSVFAAAMAPYMPPKSGPVTGGSQTATLGDILGMAPKATAGTQMPLVPENYTPGKTLIDPARSVRRSKIKAFMQELGNKFPNISNKDKETMTREFFTKKGL